MTSKQVSILGSTGSIGESTLDVIRNSSEFEVFAVSAHRNTKLLLEQCKEFNPSFAVLVDDSCVNDFSQQLINANCDTELRIGPAALEEIASAEAVDVVMAAIVESL